jgi:hypothetical protein
MTFEQQWIEYDFNPFILFSASGKVLSLNSEAQFLLGNVETATIFNIATTYASRNFGFKTTFVDLDFGRYKFFGITVGYENEEEIGVRLYQIPSFKFSKPSMENSELVNIYTLIDLCISTNSINNDICFLKEFDPSIPDVRLNTNFFIKLLNAVYSLFLGNKEVITKLFYRIGEHVKFEDAKYSLFSIAVYSPTQEQINAKNLSRLAKEAHLNLDIKEDRIIINIPMICE